MLIIQLNHIEFNHLTEPSLCPTRLCHSPKLAKKIHPTLKVKPKRTLSKTEETPNRLISQFYIMDDSMALHMAGLHFLKRRSFFVRQIILYAIKVTDVT